MKEQLRSLSRHTDLSIQPDEEKEMIPTLPDTEPSRGRSKIKETPAQRRAKEIMGIARRAKTVATHHKIKDELLRFARKSHITVKQKGKSANRAAKPIDPPEDMSFAKVEKEIEEGIESFDPEKKVKGLRHLKIPEDTFLQRQRANSSGERRFRLHGRLVR